MAEPPPDIHELFCHYNSIYFGDALGACIVSWDPRMTSMTADCDCRIAGLCEISLSEPLLKSRSPTDLKNVLLHEMIHAFLWITHNNSSHSDHGSKFWTIADLINSNDNCKDDVQRPSDGYRITNNHGFHDEEDTFSADERMFAIVKGGTGREPLPSDCTGKNGLTNDRDNLVCERNKKPCPDKYGVDIISVCETKGKTVEEVQEIGGEEIKDRRGAKRPREMTEFFSSEKSSENNFASFNQLKVMDERNRSLSIGARILKQRRIPRWKNCNLSNTEESEYHINEGEITLVMQRYGVCADEESEEESDPLINKRSERRKRMKFDASSGRCEETDLTTHEVVCLDSSSHKSDYIELDQ